MRCRVNTKTLIHDERFTAVVCTCFLCDFTSLICIYVRLQKTNYIVVSTVTRESTLQGKYQKQSLLNFYRVESLAMFYMDLKSPSMVKWLASLQFNLEVVGSNPEEGDVF
jgi:hypothetical protein